MGSRTPPQWSPKASPDPLQQPPLLSYGLNSSSTLMCQKMTRARALSHPCPPPLLSFVPTSSLGGGERPGRGSTDSPVRPAWLPPPRKLR